MITDSGLVQQPPRHSQMYQQMVGEGNNERPHKCTYCHHAFKKSSHLRQHVRSHTGLSDQHLLVVTSAGRHVCLSSHLPVFFGTGEKPYQCVTCHRSFVSSGVLKAHMKTHTGLKNYKCLICDSTFTTSGNLNRPLSTHSGMRPYMCPYCQKTVKTSVNCKKHMKTHK